MAPHYFTQQWTKQQVKDEEDFLADIGEKTLGHTASNGFRVRGVQPGDLIYIISWAGGLRLHVRVVVGELLDYSTAQRRFSYDVYDAEDHVLAVDGTEQPFDTVLLSDEDAFKVRFITSDGSVEGPKMNRKRRPEHQSFRFVREITPATASMFDRCLRAGTTHPSK